MSSTANTTHGTPATGISRTGGGGQPPNANLTLRPVRPAGVMGPGPVVSSPTTPQHATTRPSPIAISTPKSAGIAASAAVKVHSPYRSVDGIFPGGEYKSLTASPLNTSLSGSITRRRAADPNSVSAFNEGSHPLPSPYGSPMSASPSTSFFLDAGRPQSTYGANSHRSASDLPRAPSSYTGGGGSVADSPSSDAARRGRRGGPLGRDGGEGRSPQYPRSYHGRQPHENVCRHFLLGQCNRGTACRFHHPGSKHNVITKEGTPVARPLTPLADLEKQREEDARLLAAALQQQQQQQQVTMCSSPLLASASPRPPPTGTTYVTTCSGGGLRASAPASPLLHSASSSIVRSPQVGAAAASPVPSSAGSPLLLAHDGGHGGSFTNRVNSPVSGGRGAVSQTQAPAAPRLENPQYSHLSNHSAGGGSGPAKPTLSSPSTGPSRHYAGGGHATVSAAGGVKSQAETGSPLRPASLLPTLELPDSDYASPQQGHCASGNGSHTTSTNNNNNNNNSTSSNTYNAWPGQDAAGVGGGGVPFTGATSAGSDVNSSNYNNSTNFDSPPAQQQQRVRQYPSKFQPTVGVHNGVTVRIGVNAVQSPPPLQQE